MEKPHRTARQSLHRAMSFLSGILNEKQIPALMIAEEKILLPVRRRLAKSDSSLPLLGDRSESGRKSKVRVYRFEGTLKREFSNMEKARQCAESLAEKYPSLLFEPYTERRSGRERRRENDRRSGTDRRGA
jgi:hypothetical protein